MSISTVDQTIEQKAEAWALSDIPDEAKKAWADLKLLVPYGNIEIRKRAFIAGYSENAKEIERLKTLVKTAFETFHFRRFSRSEPTWEQFKKENNIL